MKIFKLLLTLLFINSLNADYLMTLTMTDTREDYIFSRCIKSYFTSDSNLYYLKSYDNTTYYKPFEDIKDYSIQSGFYFADNGVCEKFTGKLSDLELDNTLFLNSDNLSYLGLSESELNILFASSGVLISSLFLFGLYRFI